MTLTSVTITFFFSCLIYSVYGHGTGGSDNGKIPCVTARGVGNRSYKTSIASVRLGVQVEGRTANAVQRQLARASATLVRFLRRQRVQKLSTAGIFLRPVFNFNVRPRRITGYTGSNTVTFETPVSRAGPILDGAVRSGATQIQSVSFRGTPAVVRAARRMAIRDAVKMAREEAYIAADALDRDPLRPIKVEITDSFFPSPVSAGHSFARMARIRRGPAPMTQIIAREQSVTARVLVKYAI